MLFDYSRLWPTIWSWKLDRPTYIWQRNMRRLFLAIAICMAFANSSCGPKNQDSEAGPYKDPCSVRIAPDETVRVLATTGQIGDVVSMIAGLRQIDPTLWTASEIAGKSSWNPTYLEAETTKQQQSQQLEVPGVNIEVSAILGPGTDPHLFKPTLSDAQALDAADIIFYNGLHLEAQMLKALSELAKTHCVVAVGDVLATQPEVQDLFIYSGEGVVDPHIWNSPTLWAAATKVIAEHLDGAIQGEQPEFHRNAEVVILRLGMAEEIILDMFKSENLPVKYLVTAHDAFGYFARLTELENIGLQGLSTETEVSAFDVQAIAALIVEKKIPAMFVESSVSEDAIQAVRAAAAAKDWNVELGGELYSDALGPLGSGSETYLGMLQHNTLTIFNALAKTSEE